MSGLIGCPSGPRGAHLDIGQHYTIDVDLTRYKSFAFHGLPHCMRGGQVVPTAKRKLDYRPRVLLFPDISGFASIIMVNEYQPEDIQLKGSAGPKGTLRTIKPFVDQTRRNPPEVAVIVPHHRTRHRIQTMPGCRRSGGYRGGAFKRAEQRIADYGGRRKKPARALPR
jgi:hypothetical protein